MAKAQILSALLVTLGLLFASGQAHAQNPPPPQCNAGPINYNGDVDIAPPNFGQDCIINGDVTATGYIRINAPTSKIVVTGNITASNHGNVILSAGSTIEVGGSIVVNNASAPLGQAGSVDVKANMGGSGPPFVIGSASSNGVAGTINTDTALGGGNDPFFVRGGIRIRNRNDITLTSASALSVKGSASRSGVIILEAVDGNLSLPTGTLSADGQTGQSAGVVILQAHTITTQDGTIVSASDSVGQASHFVNIAASSVSFQGSNGLTIRANGGGSTASGTGSFAYALPEFGIFVTDDSTTNPQNFTWTVTYPFGTAYPGGLAWNGAVGSPLTFTANGTSHTQVLMTGYPLVFNGGDLVLAARGQSDHRVDLVYTGSTSGISGLVVNANKLTLNANANANNGAGGDIFVSIPRPTSASPQQVLFTADGPSNASGNGGTVQFFPKGDITLGGNAGQFHLSAQSGNSGGNGGRATVSNKPFTTELASNTAVQVTARGQNGDGGYLELRSLFANFNGTGLKLAADAAGTGKGGELVLDVDGPISVGSGFGAVKLSAEADATNGSDGGKITVTSGSSAAITSGQLSVKSGPTGSGGQLDLTIGGSLSLTGSLKADAGVSGNGHGGLVKVDAGDLVLNGSTTGGGQSLSADGAGTGAGGSVTVALQASSQPTTIASGQLGAVSLSANGGKNASNVFLGAGGSITLTDLNEGFIINGGALDVMSGSGQNAGSILVDAGTTLAVSGDIKAVGTGNGAKGGTIRLTAQSDSDIVFSGTGPTNIIADGGQNSTTTGDGGQITISNSGVGDIVFQNQVILSAAAEGTNGGNAGTVSATTAGGLVFGGAGSKIKANGRGVSGVTNIQLDAASDITIGSNVGEVELLAKGAAPGQKGGAVNVVSQQGTILVDGQKVLIPPGPNGEGGSGRFKGKIITISGTLDLDGKGSGSGGSLDLEATESLTLDGTISANGGNNSGNAGVINLHDTGKLTLNPDAIIRADGFNGGRAGSITLSQTGFNKMTLDATTVSAQGTCDGSNCGVINITSVAEISMIGATVHADGTNSANGGQLNIVSSSDIEPVTLDGSLITAFGSQSGGSGGFINVSSGATINVGIAGQSSGAKFRADGFVNGSGGQVRITPATTKPLVVNTPDFIITANGGPNGAGGIVVLPTLTELDAPTVPPFTPGEFYLVNHFIQASAGTGVVSPSSFGGSVTINGVTCQKTFTGYSWPTFYWNCVNPGSSAPLDGVPALAARDYYPGPLQSQQTQAANSIYVFLDAITFQNFFKKALPSNAAGYTFAEENTARVNSSVFKNTVFPNTGYGALNTAQLEESSIHELGHATDAVNTYPSVGTTYLTGIAADENFLDNFPGGGQRPACAFDGSGAFNGVIDNITQDQFCSNGGTGGVLNNPGGIYTGKTNSQIAATSTYIFALSGVGGNPGFPELYAQAFAYQTYVRLQGNQVGFPFTVTANGLFQKDYYQCAKATAAQLAGISYTPQYACN